MRVNTVPVAALATSAGAMNCSAVSLWLSSTNWPVPVWRRWSRAAMAVTTMRWADV